MKLQQLRYALEVYRQNLNVSEAAEVLFTSQPGVSKQIRLLEDELGIQIFIRQGKRIVAITEPGRLVLEIAESILRETQNIKKIGDEFSRQDVGSMTIATSHTQARYVLPTMISSFLAKYPDVQLIIKQGNPTEISEMAISGDADMGIIAEVINGYSDLLYLPCYEWNRSVIVPKGHELEQLNRPLSLEDIINYPLITYDFAFTGLSNIGKAFKQANLAIPKVVLSSADTDVIKTYVGLGEGIGLMATMAFQAETDQGLSCISAEHLFEPSQTQFVLRRDRYLRGYMYEFIELFAPDLTRTQVTQLLYEPSLEDYSI